MKKCKVSPKSYSKDNMPLRIYFSTESIRTLCISCLIACSFVCIGFLVFYRGSSTLGSTLVRVCIGLLLTLFVGGHLMLRKAKVIVEPIELITASLEQVAKGDFSVRIPESKEKIKIKELNSLITHFNQMTQALNKMEYMSKDFMTNVSHEVKTPIAAITGFTEILQDSSLPEEERQEYLALVNDEALRLSRMCENMLRMSRLDNQVIITRHEKVNITEQIRKSLILSSEKWKEKKQEIELHMEELTVTSDPDLLLQIWINLIDNAMKYSEEGTTIHITGFERESKIEVHVKDEGAGIPFEKQAHIFDKFYQCDESHKKQGNGLGLSIVKRIVELLNGTIECKSKIGEGVEMILTIPK